MDLNNVDVAKIDKNFTVNEKVYRDGQRFYSCEEEPFALYGVFREGERFVRMPLSIAQNVGNGVHGLSTHTAGGRVRFITDSPYVALIAQLANHFNGNHFTLYGSSGFDAYIAKPGEAPYYIGNFSVPDCKERDYQSIITLPEGEWEITINFPLYRTVKEVNIGLDSGATLKAPTPYKYEKPVLYYGSSVTQGGCANRPGMSYQGILSRRLDCNFINLGFSGSAKGEDTMIEYLASLDPSVFVIDYDYNAGSPEHLEATHEKLFRAFRAAHPKTPVIMISAPMPELHMGETMRARRDVIHRTYLNAASAGDKIVWFIDGASIITTEGTVDRCHPTDLGFTQMANGIEPVLRVALERSAKN